MARFWFPTANGCDCDSVEASDNITSLPIGLSDNGKRNPFVVKYRNGNRSRFVLFDPTHSLLVNGNLVSEGIRVLRHKDELQAGAQRLYFSAESAPVVETFALSNGAESDAAATANAAPRRPRCPTCRKLIEDGQAVVRCPGCQRVYHQIAGDGESVDKRCWSYSSECRFCSHPTSMSGEGAWRPQDDPACAVD